MKRKIALLLALAMVLSLVPANLFANDAAPRTIRPWVLGRVATPVALPTGTTAASPGAEFVVSIDLVNLRNASIMNTATSPASLRSIIIPLELTGSGNSDLRFVYGPAGAPGNQGEPANTAWHNGDIRQATILSEGVTAPQALVDDGDWEAHMVVIGHQRAQLFLTVSGAGLNIPADATGMLDITLPFAVRTNTSADWMVAYLNTFGSNAVLSEGPLTAFGVGGIDVLAPSTAVNFEWQANLNRVRVVELASGALTDPLDNLNPDPYGVQGVSIPGSLVSRALRPYRALAIRLTAPLNYHWGSQFETTGNAPVAEYSSVPQSAPLANDNNVYIYSPNNILLFGTDTANPLAVNTTNDTDFNNNIAVYTYMTPAGRHEKIIIIQTVRRTTNAVLSQLLGEIHIGNLVLVPGDGAPATGDVYIDARVGTVSVFREHVQPRWLNAAGTDTAPPANPATGAVGTPYTPVPGSFSYCYAGFAFATGAHQEVWPFPESINYTQVNQSERRRIVQTGVHPWGGTQVVTTGGGSDIHGTGGTVVHGLGLGWQAFPNQTHTRTILVARRAEAGLIVSTVGDAVLMRSGAASETRSVPATPTPQPNFAGMPEHTTGRTATLRIEEVVPNAHQITLGRPVTFTMPEGVILTGVRWRSHNVTATVGAEANWTRIARPPATATPNINAQFTDSTFTLRHNFAQNRSATQRIEIQFYVSVEAGFEHKFGDELVVEVGGSGVTANLNPAQNSTTVAEVYDPVVFAGGTPIQVDFVGREQNIDHTPIGQVTITETEGGMLQVGTHLWVYVQGYYGIGWPLMISRGTTFTDAESGLGLTVTENRNFQIGLSNALGGGTIRAIQLTVTQATRVGYPGTITLDATTLFGHVYQGEVYFLTVTGNAIAENHNVVANGNYIGTFNTIPYGIEIVQPATPDDGRRDPDNAANSLAGRTFSADRQFEGAPEVIWYRAAGMHHEAGFVGARFFANVAGVSEENINWVPSSRVATIAGWDYQGNWVMVTLTQGSPQAMIQRGTTEGASDLGIFTVDIATFADGLSGPTGTVTPIFRYNRIFLPFRFLFNAFGYSADYTISREGNVAVVRAN